MSFPYIASSLGHLCIASYPPCRFFQRLGPSIRSGPSFCPKINATTEGDTEILVPSGSKKAIKVKVENIVVSSGGVNFRAIARGGVGERGQVWIITAGGKDQIRHVSASEGWSFSVERVFQSRWVTPPRGGLNWWRQNGREPRRE